MRYNRNGNLNEVARTFSGSVLDCGTDGINECDTIIVGSHYYWICAGLDCVVISSAFFTNVKNA